ncbi:MAG: M6 family metalloprotease domain-containing protein [Muribaculaceae bacterium]|nr:M6 family metalloprotease domain-containing protein [Muribaculaceae bacterium]
MRKVLFILSMWLLHVTLALAVPALPGWHVMNQSDGTRLRVQAVGNAFNNAILTSDGLTVARGGDGDFYYTSSVTGLTTMRAHEAGNRSAAEEAFIRAQHGALTMQPKPYQLPDKKGQFNAVGSNAAAAVPAKGQRRIPIILVEFQDKKFSNTREHIIEEMLTGSESVSQYFKDQSNGMYEPVFDVYGIYCLSQDREYYGGHSGTVKDKGIGWLVTEACQLAAADSVSFRPYDTNNDYYCDVVIVIYAGVGEAQASMYHPEAIWPCNWTLEAAQYYSRGGNGVFSPSPDDPYINHFAVFNELHGSNDNSKKLDGIGTFAHEFGHCLGLPDMYDTGGSDYYGMGNWDIMCQGCYCNDGYTPVGYSAYEKAFMGWIEYIKPEPNNYYTLTAWNQKNRETDQAVYIRSDVNKNEYFILEYRQRKGWDRFLPGNGLMVTHITYSANAWTNNKPNNDKIQLITLLPADNKLSKYSESGDLWPQSGKTAITDESTPPTTLNMDAMGNITGNAGYLGKPVTEIVVNSDGTLSFWYMKKTHDYLHGDVDHSGKLNIDDVTMLIDYLLGGNEDGCCSTCADLDGNGIVNIDDVTGLIDKLLSGN